MIKETANAINGIKPTHFDVIVILLTEVIVDYYSLGGKLPDQKTMIKIILIHPILFLKNLKVMSKSYNRHGRKQILKQINKEQALD